MSGGWIVAALASASIGLNARFSAPPRYDGAGYAVLGEALATGRGYRAIDHPDAPRHAHFPPGYPLALAALRRAVGRSDAAAHLFSAACGVAATVAAWRWFRTMETPRVALLLGSALALNWSWGRIGGSIQSEPFYLLLGQMALLEAARVGRAGGSGRAIGLGLLLGGATLTRHVGACLTLAILVDLVRRGRRIEAATAATVAAVLLLPWVAWQVSVREGTQAALLPRGDLISLIASQGLFYVRRVPDQLVGPFVEVATVFGRSPAVSLAATTWAACASAVVAFGWLRALHIPRRRISALVPLATLPVLLAWPFTEAGRFLVPLIPMMLVGAVEGLAPAGRRGARVWAGALVLAATIPYSAYAVISGRAAAGERTHAGFDAACSWIAARGDRPGPILTRHPGEAYWQTGRLALAPPVDLDAAIDRRGVAYLLIDAERYARAPTSPLGRYVADHPDRVRRVWESDDGSAAVFEVQSGRSN